jgi:hypothetical protein
VFCDVVPAYRVAQFADMLIYPTHRLFQWNTTHLTEVVFCTFPAHGRACKVFLFVDAYRNMFTVSSCMCALWFMAQKLRQSYWRIREAVNHQAPLSVFGVQARLALWHFACCWKTNSPTDGYSGAKQRQLTSIRQEALNRINHCFL